MKEKQKIASEATGEKKKEKEKEKKKESKSEKEAEEELKKGVDKEEGADREEEGADGAEVWQSEQRRVQMEQNWTILGSSPTKCTYYIKVKHLL